MPVMRMNLRIDWRDVLFFITVELAPRSMLVDESAEECRKSWV